MATGITGLFLSLFAIGHGLLILLGSVYFEENTRIVFVGLAALLVGLLFMLGGAFAFKMPHLAKNLFVIAFILTILTLLAFAWIMAIWFVFGALLIWLNGKAVKEMEPEEIPEQIGIAPPIE